MRERPRLSKDACRRIEERLAHLKKEGNTIQVTTLAERLRVSLGHLSNVINGHRAGKENLIVRLADILDLQVGDLWGGSPEGSPPPWAQTLEEIFDHRFKIVSIEKSLPDVRPIPKRFSLGEAAKKYEKEAKEEAGGYDQPLGIVKRSDIEELHFERDERSRLVLPVEVATWSQLTAMRKAGEPCYPIYVGAMLMSDDLQLLVNHRSEKVRTYANAFASFGGSYCPPDDKRRDVFNHDEDLLETARRETYEETKAIGIELITDREILVMLEQDTTEIGKQHSVQVILLEARFPKAQMDKALRVKLQEGTVKAVQFDPRNRDLADWLLAGKWASCGLAHYLAWLARGGPGLPSPYKQYALEMFEEVTSEMRKRGSWHSPRAEKNATRTWV